MAIKQVKTGGKVGTGRRKAVSVCSAGVNIPSRNTPNTFNFAVQSTLPLNALCDSLTGMIYGSFTLPAAKGYNHVNLVRFRFVVLTFIYFMSVRGCPVTIPAVHKVINLVCKNTIVVAFTNLEYSGYISKHPISTRRIIYKLTDKGTDSVSKWLTRLNGFAHDLPERLHSVGIE